MQHVASGSMAAAAAASTAIGSDVGRLPALSAHWSALTPHDQFEELVRFFGSDNAFIVSFAFQNDDP